MNVYILVEGKRTEKKVYPAWLSILTPHLKKVDIAGDVSDDNYYLISGEGYPSLLSHLKNAIEEVNEISKFQYLVLCLDAEEETVQGRIDEINTYLKREKCILQHAELVIVVQNPCFETWFLGNRKLFKRQPQSPELCRYIRFYNVSEEDPEEMPALVDHMTRAQFHVAYLREMFEERNISYSKRNPGELCETRFLTELIKRNEETSHISSFREFLNLCDMINDKK